MITSRTCLCLQKSIISSIICPPLPCDKHILSHQQSLTCLEGKRQQLALLGLVLPCQKDRHVHARLNQAVFVQQPVKMVIVDNKDVLSAEEQRLREDRERKQYWKKWGPYVAERQWATVREDYS